jgi:hypothetical protein
MAGLSLEVPEDFPIPPGLALNLAGAAASHPFQYAKVAPPLATASRRVPQVLMQLGHEPLGARDTTTLLGRPALAYPSVFSYVGHIRARDGFAGLWRGLPPKLCSLVAQHFTQAKFNELYPAGGTVQRASWSRAPPQSRSRRSRWRRS